MSRDVNARENFASVWHRLFKADSNGTLRIVVSYLVSEYLTNIFRMNTGSGG